jgi:hypothetical protein
VANALGVAQCVCDRGGIAPGEDGGKLIAFTVRRPAVDRDVQAIFPEAGLRRIGSDERKGEFSFSRHWCGRAADEGGRYTGEYCSSLQHGASVRIVERVS